MAKRVRKKVDPKDIESAEELPREEKIKTKVKKTNLNQASEDFLIKHGLVK